MILGICGSPRNGSTEYVLKQALQMLSEKGFETDFFTVRAKNIGFCTHCDYCLKTGECNVKDDMAEAYLKLQVATAIIIATPVYNGGVSAQTKTVIDRCRSLLVANPGLFRNRVGMAIAVGGDRNGGQELALQQVLTFYVLNGMIPVSGGSFGANLGVTFWSKDTLENAKLDQEGFRILKKSVKRMADFLKKYSPEKQK